MEAISDNQPDPDFTFLVKAPRSLVDKLEAEAKREQRNRNRQLIRILEERYGLVELPEEPEAERMSA